MHACVCACACARVRICAGAHACILDMADGIISRAFVVVPHLPAMPYPVDIPQTGICGQAGQPHINISLTDDAQKKRGWEDTSDWIGLL